MRKGATPLVMMTLVTTAALAQPGGDKAPQGGQVHDDDAIVAAVLRPTMQPVGVTVGMWSLHSARVRFDGQTRRERKGSAEAPLVRK